MSKYGRQMREPEGFEYVEPTLTALENELREKVNESHEGLRKVESGWPVHQLNWQKTRYIYDLYYIHNKRISREVYDYCINNKLIDAIAKRRGQACHVCLNCISLLCQPCCFSPCAYWKRADRC